MRISHQTHRTQTIQVNILKEAITSDKLNRLILVKHTLTNDSTCWAPQTGFSVDLRAQDASGRWRLEGRAAFVRYEEALDKYYQLVEEGARFNAMYFEPVNHV